MFRYIITMLMLLGVSSSVFAATSTYDRFVGNHAKFKNVSSVSGQFSGTVYAADAVFKGPSIDSRAYSTLALADAAATSAGKQLVISTVYTTVPATLSAPAVKILPGGKLNGSGSVVITGQFEGSDGCFGANQAVTGLKEAWPDWWTTNAVPGTTDMTNAIQKAVAAANRVKLSAGVYSSDLITLRSQLNITGAGKGITILRRKAAFTNSLLFYSGDATNRLVGLSISDLTIDGTNSALGGAAVYVSYFGRAYIPEGETATQTVSTISNCELTGFAYGAYIEWGDQFSINDCDIHHNVKGVYANNSANLLNITNSAIHHNSNEGVLIANVSSNCTIMGSYVNDNTLYGVRVYVAEAPSILYTAFNRNAYFAGATGNAVYLEGYDSGTEIFYVDSATIEGCLFGANAWDRADIGTTYVRTANIEKNYFYNIQDTKPYFIRLFNESKGVTISSNRWKKAPGVTPDIPKVSAVSGVVYTLIDGGDTTSFNMAVQDTGAFILSTKNGLCSTSYSATISGGVLDLTASTSPIIVVGILNTSVTSVLFPSTPVDGQELTLRFKQGSSGGPYTVAGWPANVALAGGNFTATTTANRSDVICFRYSTVMLRWYEISRSMNLAI